MNRALTFGLGFGCAGVLATCVGLPLAMGAGQLFGETEYSNGTRTAAVTCGDPVKIVQVAKQTPKVRGWNTEQIRNAATIVQVGQEMNVPPRGWVIAVATAMQESTLRNLGHLGDRNDHDSQGLFQQRPSQGWGTVKQITDPRYASRKFYEKLLKVDGWQEMSLTRAAQKVQISAYPNAYAKHEDTAARIVDAVTGGAAKTEKSAKTVGECAADKAQQVDRPVVTSGGFVRPVKALIGDAWRSRTRPNHQGVDLIANKGVPVYAIADGVVVHMECDRTERGYDCSHDGGTGDWPGGCGWYIDIKHANNVISRSCHLRDRPLFGKGDKVKAGDKIGVVGSTGSSSGPHLHFEIHMGTRGPESTVDPVKFMRDRGAPLGTSKKGGEKAT